MCLPLLASDASNECRCIPACHPLHLRGRTLTDTCPRGHLWYGKVIGYIDINLPLDWRYNPNSTPLWSQTECKSHRCFEGLGSSLASNLLGAKLCPQFSRKVNHSVQAIWRRSFDLSLRTTLQLPQTSHPCIYKADTPRQGGLHRGGGQGGRPPPQLEHWGGIAPPNFRLQYKGVTKSPLLSLFCNSVYWLKPHNNVNSWPPNLAVLPPPPPARNPLHLTVTYNFLYRCKFVIERIIGEKVISLCQQTGKTARSDPATISDRTHFTVLDPLQGLILDILQVYMVVQWPPSIAVSYTSTTECSERDS